MEYQWTRVAPVRDKTGCAVVVVYEDGQLSAAARALDEASKGVISRLIRRKDLSGRCGESLLLPTPAGLPCERLLMLGCGKEQGQSAGEFRESVARAVRAVRATGAVSATFHLAEITVAGRDDAWKVRQTVEACEDSLYRYDRTKRQKNGSTRPLARVRIAADIRPATAARAIEEGRATAAGVALVKELGNLPGNICTPTYLAGEAAKLARTHSLRLRVLTAAGMKRLGMGALLSVSRGSRQPPRLIVLEYRGAKKGAQKAQGPVALVGKGITFDAGGISIKPAGEMDEMKYDMCGGAAVLGTIKAAALLRLPIDIVGVIPASENLPDGDASKPGDIVTSMSGQTIEILNTDAEGRLVLCDALTYVTRYKPAAVIDIATLTGACVIALGKQASGLLANDDQLADDLLAAGEAAHDRAWRLPLWPEYDKQLESPFADMANIGGRQAGTITAACFLSRYTKKFKWAHLDIAGTAWNSGKDKGGTGRPVPMLLRYLITRAAGMSRPRSSRPVPRS